MLELFMWSLENGFMLSEQCLRATETLSGDDSCDAVVSGTASETCTLCALDLAHADCGALDLP